MFRTHIRFLPVIIIVIILVACSQPAEEATPLPSPGADEQVAAATEVPASATAPATTATAVPPTPTLAPSATPAPSATATLTPSPTPLVLRNAQDFGDTRNPLTGEMVDDPEILERRPIAVKISNYPQQWVRPQSGLSQADLVFEHVTEGYITRFTAIFYSETPEDVGPIRSGRLIDLELPAMYDTAFAYSGASIGVSARLLEIDFRERVLRSNVPGYYRTGENKPTEHTLYGNPVQWWEELEDRGLNTRPTFGEQMAFSEQPPAGGEPVEHVHVQYRSDMWTDWYYDEDTDRYIRWTDGDEHIDQNTGQQITSANVVVVYAPHVINYSICENQQGDQCLAFSTEIQIWGEGQAQIFRNGQMYDATWKRWERNDMLTFYDEAGEEIPLAIGNTWFQMVPAGSDMVCVDC